MGVRDNSPGCDRLVKVVIASEDDEDGDDVDATNIDGSNAMGMMGSVDARVTGSCMIGGGGGGVTMGPIGGSTVGGERASRTNGDSSLPSSSVSFSSSLDPSSTATSTGRPQMLDLVSDFHPSQR